MKRRPPTVDAVPAMLTRFDADEWGGGVDAAQLWYDARERWADDGNGWPPMDLPAPDVAWNPVDDPP